METNKNLQKEITKTLGALDNWKQIETDPFFYTRLSVRIENKTSAFNWFLNSPILKPALITMTLLINIFTINYLITTNASTQTNDFVSAFTEEYMLDSSTETYLVLNEE